MIKQLITGLALATMALASQQMIYPTHFESPLKAHILPSMVSMPMAN